MTQVQHSENTYRELENLLKSIIEHDSLSDRRNLVEAFFNNHVKFFKSTLSGDRSYGATPAQYTEHVRERLYRQMTEGLSREHAGSIITHVDRHDVLQNRTELELWVIKC